MRKFHYPTGTKPVMRNYHRKSVRPKRNRFRHVNYSKYRAHKIKYDGHKFDSKAEFHYYVYLKIKHVKFRTHVRFMTIPHQTYRFQGHTYKIRKHSYTPDFVIYDRNRHIKEVDDIKGISQVPAYDHLRMDLFSIKYHLPVTIVRIKRHHFIKKTRNL